MILSSSVPHFELLLHATLLIEENLEDSMLSIMTKSTGRHAAFESNLNLNGRFKLTFCCLP